MDPGTYQGPMQIMTQFELSGQYNGDLVLRTIVVNEDETLCVRPQVQGVDDLCLPRTDDDLLRWQHEVDEATRFIANGGTWAPGLHTIEIRRMKGNEATWGVRFFVVRAEKAENA